MARCTHCGAPLPKNSMICEYCGVRNDIELKSKNIGAELPQSNRFCPDCLVQLESSDVGVKERFIIEKCPKCYGLFFDHDELEKLLKESVDVSHRIDRQKLHALMQYPRHQDKIIYRRCPVCNQTMQRRNYARTSGVIMDVCFEHGIWLDAGEFKQLQEWARLGGVQKALQEPQRPENTQFFGTMKELKESKESDKWYEVLSDMLSYGWR
ncbi:MAG: zf-TFIIB domain-containing protein [Thiovulaceae bacterium]|nr:zf-TFIIB domain-containing protein [Sulfurimonadaceae bacterium]